MYHEGQTQYLEQIMALLMHGIEIGANDAEVLRALKRAKASGDFLLHLGHTDGTLAEIVGKRYARIGRQTQHLCGVFAHAVQQAERHRLFDPIAALVVSDGMRITGLSIMQKIVS